MKIIFRTVVIVAFTTVCLSVWAQKPALPTDTIPDGLGYNIHFTHARPGEMEMIADSGATIIRMDFAWGGTEREKGVYDFKAFEHLTDSLEKHKIRPLYILDYSNRHYDGGLSPHSEEGRTAFANWAAAAAVHFKDRGIFWEMYNEPNIQFWKPKPDPEKYILLALEVGRALRQAAPNELYIGPGTAQSPTLHTIDFPFLEQCFKAGLLEYWDAVSVHPYRQSGPETVLKEYAQLRYLIDKYAPRDNGTLKKIPILSAEWGYSSVWGNFDDEKQGKMLPRQWMINLACDVPISIWYDWHDDGTDPKEPEHHFGTTNFEHKKDQTPVYDPKPSYIAAKTFNETFKGFRYNKRLWLGDDEIFVFLFDKDDGKSVKLAAWTTSKEPKEITIPSVLGKFEAISYLGEKLPDLNADENGLKLTVSDGPVYLTPEKTAGFWSDVAKIASEPLAVQGSEYSARTSSGQRKDRHHDPAPFLPVTSAQFKPTVQGKDIVQNTFLYPIHSMSIGLPIPWKDEFVVEIDNPSGQAFDGVVVVKDIKGLKVDKNRTLGKDDINEPLVLKEGEKKVTLRLPARLVDAGEYRFSVDVLITKYKRERKFFAEAHYSNHSLFPIRTMRVFGDFAELDTVKLNENWSIVPDGDANVGSEQKIEIDGGKLELTFKYADGWKFVRIFPKNENVRKFEGKPKALAMQVQGDGTPVSINVRYRDNKGQTFQIHGGHLRDDSVQNLEFPLDSTNASHWGGPNDGVIHYPIQLDSIVVDGTRKGIGPGTVTFSSPVVIYE